MNGDNKPAGQEMVFDKYVAIALVVGLIAGFIIGNSVGASKSKTSTMSTSTDSMMVDKDSASDGDSMMSGKEMLSGDEVAVSDQKAGRLVVVDKLVLDKAYWVAVRDSESTTIKPYVLGAKKLQAGTYTNESIYVTRSTEAGKTYDIVFYQDKGDFNYDPSLLVKAAEGDRLMGGTFKAN